MAHSYTRSLRYFCHRIPALYLHRDSRPSFFFSFLTPCIVRRARSRMKHVRGAWTGAYRAAGQQLLEQAELYESKSSARKAGRLVKLLVQVERSLNSAEAAEIAAQSDPSRASQYMKEAGLRFLPEPPPPPPPQTPEDKNATTTAATSDASIAQGAAPTQMASKVPARSRDESSSKTAAQRAAAKTAVDRRRASSSASATAAAGAERRGTSGTSGQKKKKKKTKKERNRLGGSGAAAEEDGSSPAGATTITGEPLKTFVLTVAGCEVRCLLMLEEREGDGEGEGEGEGDRLVVAVGDSLTGAALLQSLFEEPAVVQLASHGLMRETAYVNRAAFQVCVDGCTCAYVRSVVGAWIGSNNVAAQVSFYAVECLNLSCFLLSNRVPNRRDLASLHVQVASIPRCAKYCFHPCAIHPFALGYGIA